MNVNTIVTRVNQMLAGETLRYDEIEPLLDKTVDAINEALSSKFPVFSEWKDNDELHYDGSYNFFPDKYIRTVVIPGAANFFYQIDEEGEQVANSFTGEYNKGLFLMTRDFIFNVPEEWKEDKQGFVEFEWDLSDGRFDPGCGGY